MTSSCERVCRLAGVGDGNHASGVDIYWLTDRVGFREPGIYGLRLLSVPYPGHSTEHGPHTAAEPSLDNGQWELDHPPGEQGAIPKTVAFRDGQGSRCRWNTSTAPCRSMAVELEISRIKIIQRYINGPSHHARLSSAFTRSTTSHLITTHPFKPQTARHPSPVAKRRHQLSLVSSSPECPFYLPTSTPTAATSSLRALYRSSMTPITSEMLFQS